MPSNRLPIIVLVLACALSVVPRQAFAVNAVGPMRVFDPAVADTLRARYERDRTDTQNNLKSGATSYLAAVGRTDFADHASLVVGRAADCDLHVDDAAFAVTTCASRWWATRSGSRRSTTRRICAPERARSHARPRCPLAS